MQTCHQFFYCYMVCCKISVKMISLLQAIMISTCKMSIERRYLKTTTCTYMSLSFYWFVLILIHCIYIHVWFSSFYVIFLYFIVFRLLSFVSICLNIIFVRRENYLKEKRSKWYLLKALLQLPSIALYSPRRLLNHRILFCRATQLLRWNIHCR